MEKMNNTAVNYFNKEFSIGLFPEIEEAREKALELDAILDWSHDGIWIMDGKGMTLRVSKSWEDFAGIKREDMIGRSVYDIVNEGYYSDSAAIHVMQEMKPVSIIYETRTGRDALVTGIPVFDKDGSIWRIVSNIRDMTELLSIKRELEKTQEEIRLLREQQLQSDSLVIRSDGMKEVVNFVSRAAQAEATILILGDSGTGKEVLAKLIHKLSKRGEEQFIKINCGAIPETLIESELFGYEGGSFTGARQKGKIGLFEMAEGGTLFLDEIGEMPLQLQPKLLLAIQDRQVYRVGGTTPINLNVRIIAATNRDLKKMVAEGKFREDLYYRLNVVPVTIPPLRERKEDILPLLFHFLDKFNKKYKLNKRYSSPAINLMVSYSWPGNVRELENLTERLVVTSPGEEICQEQLPEELKRELELTEVVGCESINLKKATESLEKRLLQQALERFGSTRKAAAALGVAQPTVVRKAKKYGLRVTD
ncbi:sigma 54-interacting transcriptional regulator [Desulfosporosinus sp. PR]|uniref:sigma-54 interaction domain-containing protein n=1 Tax=Candidatus Desulfosporosinus nitrosoreducens TaxID=3401928 RepID=UPI0027FD9E6C|nr:sigma 54-interacting transcriptional regulator [Desulfosporosinus sp. PR]MDQ7092594.1 sigma 54-interacting transcriptional regulator [Desulfosporosinus sp. PR]